MYILILPSFGIVSEVLPVFSKKPLFGYPLVVFSGAAIGFVGWGVWAHHMFASGLGPISVAVFSVATMAIAIPTGVKIVNWVMTMWGGKLRYTVAMMFAIGLIVQFTIGGLSGVTHAVAPSDTQQTDTYYIVAHFHYVLFGGAILGIFAGLYYWWPKVFGRMLSETLGKWNFWMMVIGLNMAFGPMHIIGLQGQPRRMYVWTEAYAGEGFFNLEFWNLIATDRRVRARRFGVLIFFYNVWRTHFGKHQAPPAPLDPWDARHPRVDRSRRPPPELQLQTRMPGRRALSTPLLAPQVHEPARGRHRRSQGRSTTAEQVLAIEDARRGRRPPAHRRRSTMGDHPRPAS